MSLFQKIICSAKVRETSRLTIRSPECGTLHYQADTSYLYAVVSSDTYPQRCAFQFLDEMSRLLAASYGDKMATGHENDLSNALKGPLSNLSNKFDDLASIDKVAAVNGQLDDVKLVMQDNVNQMLQNQESAANLEERSNVLKNQAQVFNQQATSLKREMWWQSTQIQIIIVALIIALIAIVVLSVLVLFGTVLIGFLLSPLGQAILAGIARTLRLPTPPWVSSSSSSSS